MAAPIEPRWLDTQQQRIWRSWLNGVAAINQELQVELERFGLDLSEYEIMVNLSEEPERTLRMSELAERSRQSRSRLTHTVSRMEKKGLVRRSTCASDRRGVFATLTPAGYELLVAAAPHHVESVRRALVDPVSPEDYQALGRVMEAVLAAHHMRH